MELTVTGCLNIEAVCRIGGTRFASFLKLFVKSYCLLAAWPFDFDFAPLEEDFPFVVAKAEKIYNFLSNWFNFNNEEKLSLN
jgi:hypothetical protein